MSTCLLTTVSVHGHKHSLDTFLFCHSSNIRQHRIDSNIFETLYPMFFRKIFFDILPSYKEQGVLLLPSNDNQYLFSKSCSSGIMLVEVNVHVNDRIIPIICNKQ